MSKQPQRRVRLRSALDDIPTYIPGKNFPGALKIASNESSLPPLPSVISAITEAAQHINRYPDNAMLDLHDCLAKSAGLTIDQVQTGTGSVMLCHNLIAITCEPGDEVLFAWRSFELYPISSKIVGAQPIMVPLDVNHRHDLQAMADAITDRTRIIFVCNPNNPTGTIVTAAALKQFLQQVPGDVLVVLDEAYIEFVLPSDDERYNSIELLEKFPNLVVLRTFSKAYGLAGLRVGYALGDPEIITALRKVHAPFSVNTLAQAAGVASIKAQDELLTRASEIANYRTEMQIALTELGYPISQSHANFVWLALGERSMNFAAEATNNNILIRPFADSGVRVTIGQPEENEIFLEFARRWAPQLTVTK